MNVGKTLLMPFSLIYGLAGWTRNKLFDLHLLPRHSFDIPVICVGNLSAGGTGKTPHIEYLIRLLQGQFPGLCTLSRGYGRKTHGFILAGAQSLPSEIGDEPCQFVCKFPGVRVAVDERRAHGIEQLLSLDRPANLVLLDDAFQHRYVKPGLSILLTDYYHPFFEDHVLPSGMLREFKSGSKRADIIVVTKCPPVIAPVDRKNYIERIRPSAQQRVYFSKIRYEKLKPVFPETTDELCEGKHVSSILLFAGIANIYPLEEQIKRGCTYMETIRYPDHHRYSASDLKHIRERFTNIVGRNKILVTTEKDRMRISEPGLIEILKDIPLYEQPIEVEFFREDGEWFDKQIKEYAGKNQTKC